MTQFEIATIIVSSISALITFFAVCVALWQSLLQFRKKIQVAYHNNVEVSVGNRYPKMVEFILYNSGNTKVSIYNLYLGKNCKYALSNTNGQVLFFNPSIIDVGESLSICVGFEDIIFAVKNLVKKNAKLTNRKITFVVEDITGKKFYKTIEHTYNDYLSWFENKICLFPIIKD